jgi:hypothetical protein
LSFQRPVLIGSGAISFIKDPHASNTKGKFIIFKEEASLAGVRIIKARIG